MTRYDRLIQQEKENAELRKEQAEEQKRSEEERKRCYIEAFRNALPEFYVALFRNDNWREFEFYHRKFVHYGIDKRKGIAFIGADSDGYCSMRYWMGKDGKYYRSESGKRYMDTIISEEELAEALYRQVIKNIHYFPNGKLKDAVKRDDFYEVPILYFSEVIIYNNRW